MTDWERFSKAIALRDAGRDEEALREIRALTEEQPSGEDKTSLILNEITCLVRLDRLSEARDTIDRLQAETSTKDLLKPRVEFMDACLMSQEGKLKEALAKLENLSNRYRDILARIENRDLHERVKLKYGALLVDLDRSSAARTILEEAISFQMEGHERANLFYYLGACYYDLRDFDLSKHAFEKALEDSLEPPFEVKAHYYVGLIYEKQGAYAWAKKHFNACEGRLDNTTISSSRLYAHLRALSLALGAVDDARHYEELGRNPSR